MYQFLKMKKMEQRSMSKFEVITRWVESLKDNAIHVPPKAITLLQSVLDETNITLKPKRDVWEEYLKVKGRDFTGWYETLTPSERNTLEQRKQEELRKAMATQKHLLKG